MPGLVIVMQNTEQIFRHVNFFQLCDLIPLPTFVSIAGNFLLALTLLLLGPAPFVPLKPSVALIQGAMGLNGFCASLIMVSSFLRAQRAAIRLGFSDDIDTYIFISGTYLDK